MSTVEVGVPYELGGGEQRAFHGMWERRWVLSGKLKDLFAHSATGRVDSEQRQKHGV